MKELNHSLINSRKDKHHKLSQRFLKLLKSGTFKSLTKRRQYQIVERIKKLERQLKDFNLSNGSRISLNLKHWAVALALGVVSYTASAQDKPAKPEQKRPFGLENKDRDLAGLQKNHQRVLNAQGSKVAALGFELATTLGTPHIDEPAVGDFDGDGDVDMIYSTYGQDSYLLRNDGNFTFNHQMIALPGMIDEPFVADFDGDGDSDILSEAYSDTIYGVQVLDNDGTANFSLSGSIFSGSGDLYYTRVADLDADGDIDIITKDDYNILIAGVNDGANNFATTNLADSIYSVHAVGDIDSDGDVDILVEEGYYYITDSTYGWGYTKRRNTILFNNAGEFSSSGEVIGDGVNYQRAYLNDIDKDGDLDLIQPHYFWPDQYADQPSYELKVFLNDGQGNFPSTPTSVTPTDGNFYEPQFVDIDGDNDVDIMPFNYGEMGATVLLNNGSTQFTTTVINVSPGANPIADLDGDGDIDILSFSYTNTDAWRNDGNLEFTLVQSNILELATSASLGILDLNGDGAAEILQFGASKIWENSGDSRSFTVSKRFPTTDIDHEKVDIDGDGDMDVVTAVYSYNNHIGNVLRNDNGTLAVADSLGVEIEAEGYRISAGDIDKDGDADIVILTELESSDQYYDAMMTIWSNDGSGQFSYGGSHTGNDSTRYSDIKLLDIDDDGDADIVSLIEDYNDIQSGIKVGVNDGTGAFNFGATVVTPDAYADFERFTTADFDNDGDVDIITLNSGGGSSYLFENDGQGQFMPSPIPDMAIEDDGNIISGDLDNDGDSDIVLFYYSENGNNYYSVKEIFLNDGTGNITTSGTVFTSPGYTPYGVDLGDIDNDGDLDLVVGSLYSPIELWVNILNAPSQGEQDRNALIAIYNALGQPSLGNWNSEEELSTWEGVTVDNNRVIGLDLSDRGLTGAMPEAMLNLTNLVTLNLSGNNINDIPDLSGLTALTSADVSGNSLQFDDLEPSADVDFLVYSPQANIGTPQLYSSAVGTSLEISENVAGTSNTYQWYFNNDPVTGATSPSYVISSLSIDNMGSYSLEVNNTMLPGLTLISVPDQVVATATVQGTVTDDEDNIVSETEVILLRITQNAFDTTQVVTPDNNGVYQFNDVVLDNYQIVANPDLTVNPDYLPTYFPATIYWEDADTIVVNDNLAGIDIPIEIFVEESLGGTGEIAGTLYEEVEEGKLAAKKRVAKANVTIRRRGNANKTKNDFQGKMLENDELIAHVKTNEEGNFTFSELTDGVYRLNIQYPGYPMDTTSFTDIPISTSPDGRMNSDGKVQVEALVAGGKIVVTNVTVVSIDSDPLLANLMLYPNPSQGRINIVANGYEGKSLNAELFNMNGKLIFSAKLDNIKVEHIDLSTVPAGTYILKLNTSDGINNAARTFKVILE